MDKEINTLGALSMAISDEVRAATNKVVGMSGETIAAIIMLGANPGLTVGQVAHALALTPSGAVRLIDRLVSDGYVLRKQGRDQRVVTLELTDEGSGRRFTALAEREGVLRRALGGFSSEEIATLGAMVDRMLCNLMLSPDQDFRFCRMCNEDACEPHCPVEARRCELDPGT